MPKFYFHIVRRGVILDEFGTIFPDVEAAIAHARQMARDFKAKDDGADGSIVVENEDAGDMFELPIAGLSS